MIDEKAFDAKVRKLAAKLSPRVHEFVVREGARHGAGPMAQDPITVAAYIAAVAVTMGDELGSMATCFGPDGPEMVQKSFLSAFEVGAREMRAVHDRGGSGLN